MRRNEKLTKILQGRAISEIRRESDATFVTFDDGSRMKIKTGGAAQNAPAAVGDKSAQAKTDAAKTDTTKKVAATCGAGEAKPETKSVNEPSRAQKVKSVRQQETDLCFEFEDGTSLLIQTREETASVMLRDKNGVMEYAD